MTMPTEAFALDPNDQMILRSQAHIDEATRRIAANKNSDPLIELTEAQAVQLEQVYPTNRVKEARRLIEQASEAHAVHEATPAMTHHLDKPLEEPKPGRDEETARPITEKDQPRKH